ncbi:hypothetical protein LEP1GSC059_1864 [Leptospira noguchii serovar Panama str. CZ214]|uniref:Uncharacterized protein n=1 Tax=Leptospira noguchii serovar Panama str. CZ214 TaxID=1001595 RepID=T0FJ67_9LEPT|nr:hypothetical protein LEP1GSC059_1864 [Leptospira noguchii serovar Panama str. CZ214]
MIELQIRFLEKKSIFDYLQRSIDTRLLVKNRIADSQYIFVFFHA